MRLATLATLVLVLAVIFSSCASAQVYLSAQNLTALRITYPSSVDKLVLGGRVIFNDSREKAPLLVIMHGYSGNMTDVLNTSIRFAQAGVFTLLIDMRGRNSTDSNMVGDDSMYELFDIADGINAVLNHYPNADKDNINILGYSGGGGNALAMVQKFPDLFQNAYAFFGIVNYCDGKTSDSYSWYGDGVYKTEKIEQRIGDGNSSLFERFPNRCLARNALKLIPNAQKTHIYLYGDDADIIVPARYAKEYARMYKDAGLGALVSINITGASDPHRYLHGYADTVPDLMILEPNIIVDISSSPRDISLPAKGHLNIGGYVATKPFTILLGDEVFENGNSKGREGLVSLDYSLGKTRTFDFVDKSYGAPFVKNVTLVLHGVAPITELRYACTTKKTDCLGKVIATKQGDAIITIPLQGSAHVEVSSGHSYGLFIGVAFAFVFVAVLFLRRR